jgi:predicted AlkP superfamily pyrophosphatase or phosphodiesterase
LLTKHNGVYAGRVGIHTEDGSAFVFIHNAADRPTLTSKLKAYFQRLPGVAAVYTNREALQLGLPSLSSTDQAADLFLAAKPGYAFIQDTVGPLAEKINPARGTHGYLNSDPDMQALFIASGAHIRHGIDVGSISNLRVAPTIAALLGISLPAAKQPSLKQALQ